MDAYRSKRSASQQKDLIESLGYLDLRGLIQMRSPEEEYCIFEDWTLEASQLRRVHLGRRVAGGGRAAVQVYDLKKRKYISRTSMDSELALVTANLTLAGPGKLFYDPFVGTGSFPIACAHFGAVCLGSDIDGRSIRGDGQGKDLMGNFLQYDLVGRWLDGFVADLTHSPVRQARWLDGIVCDPPYGVREGPKVLGSRDMEKKEALIIDGVLAHRLVSWPTLYGERLIQHSRRAGYIPPKRPYGFDAMLEDILHCAATMLVDHGRLSLWMPTANDESEHLDIPSHPCLERVSVCVQTFNKCGFLFLSLHSLRWKPHLIHSGSRRLLTYRRRQACEVDPSERNARVVDLSPARGQGANDLNPFRKRVSFLFSKCCLT